MEKFIEIPEGYEARIEGNKVVFEPKESEDERIRKEMINYFHGCIQRNKKTGFRVEQIKTWIDYLEKQKEDQDYIRREDHERIRTDYYNRGFEDGVNSVKNEQKPAEWSEEDEKKRNGLIKGLENRMGFGWASDPFSREEYIAWLKSLRPYRHRGEDYVRVYEPRPGTMISTAVRDAIQEANKGNECLILRFNGVCLSVEKNSNPDTLEAMYHRRWKPSEEQMIYLKEAINKFDFCDAENAGLQALYEQLKKLK